MDSRFRDGWEDLQNDTREGRQSTSTNEENDVEVQKLVEEDRRITIYQVASAMDQNIRF